MRGFSHACHTNIYVSRLQLSGKIKEEILLIQSPCGGGITETEQYVHTFSVIMPCYYVHSVDSEDYTVLSGNPVSFSVEVEKGRVDKKAGKPDTNLGTLLL